MTALYNSEQINELAAFFLTRDAWASWTPTVTQGVAVTVSVTYARYVAIANTVIMVARLGVTSAGTGGSVIVIGGIPAAIQPVNVDAGGINVIGIGLVYDNGTAYYVGALSANSATGWQINAHGLLQAVGNTPSFALASGDVISFQAAYERV